MQENTNSRPPKEHGVSSPAIINPPQQQQFTRTAGPVSIVRDILTPQDRPVRLPLAQWAAKNLDEFTRLRQSGAYDQPEVCGPIVDYFNEAALIETYYGRLDRAEVLCHAAMKWVATLIETTGSAFCCRFAFQPYVNLGRLDRIEKRWQESLDKFQVVQGPAGKFRPLRPHCHRQEIPRRHGGKISRSLGFTEHFHPRYPENIFEGGVA